MQNNRTQKRATAQEPTEADVRQFIKSMSGKGKRGWVPPEKREGLAKELGTLVAGIGNGDPVAGLKRIKATLGEGEMPGLHEHRQRIILFPEEQPAQRPTWVAGWGEYLRFADKALDLLAGGRTGVALCRWKLTELKRLVSIGQGIEPEADRGGKTATALLRSWSEKVVQIATNGTRLEELWEALDEAPVEVRELDDSSGAAMQHLGNLPLAANGLPQEGGAQTSRVFVTGAPPKTAGRGLLSQFGCAYDSSWSRPVIFLGWLSYQDSFDVFILPPELRGMEDAIQHWTGHLHLDTPPEFDEWFKEIDEGLCDLPSVNYDEGLEYGWFKNHFYALCGLYLQIRPDFDGKPEAVICHVPSDNCIPKWEPNFSFDIDIDIQACDMDIVGYLLNSPGFSPDRIVEDFPERARLVATKDDMKSLGLPDGEFLYRNGLSEIEINPQDFGLEWEDVYGNESINSESGENKNTIPFWNEFFSSPFGGNLDSQRDRILFNRNRCYNFYPSFKFDESLPSAAPAGSVAAALIANAHGSPEDRIANVLRAQTEKIAKAGLTYVDGLHAFHQSAVENM
jgi:hypothetical protein